MNTIYNTKQMIRSSLKSLGENIYITVIKDNKVKITKRHKTVYKNISKECVRCDYIFRIEGGTQVLCAYMWDEEYICTNDYYTSDGTYTIQVKQCLTKDKLK